MPKYDNAKLINEETGAEIKPGDVVPNFRGEPTRFLYVSRIPEGNSGGKIVTDGREVYPSVLGAYIDASKVEGWEG